MGMSIPEHKAQRIKEGAWKEMEDGWKAVVNKMKVLGKGKGPFVYGDKVTVADLWMVGYLKWAEYGCKESAPEVYGRILEWGGEELKGFLEASKGWTERDSF